MLGYKYLCSGLRWPDATYTLNIPTCGVICSPLFKLFGRVYNSEKKTEEAVLVLKVCIDASTSPDLRPGLITAGRSASTPNKPMIQR